MVQSHTAKSSAFVPPECHQKGNSVKKKMTDRFIRSIVPNPTQRIEISDTERVGLRFRMSTKGNASWLYQKKIKNGARRGYKLGSFPAMSLAEARSAALEMQIQAEHGVDSVRDARNTKQLLEAEELAKRSVKDILDLYISTYLEQELKVGQSRDERKRQLTTYLAPFNSTYISDLSRADLQLIIDGKQAEGKKVMANRIRAALRAFTGWAHKRVHIEQNIGILLQSAGKEKSRERTPSLDQVRTIWGASFSMGNLWGAFFRICILTGQRSRKDILEMRWSWIDFERCRYEIPNPKNGRPHIVHLSAPAIKELLNLQGLQSDNSTIFVFTTTGRRAASGVSKAKLKLDNHIHGIWGKAGHQLPFEPWVLHDLRRAQATALAEAGFDESVVDRIQNHVATGSRASAVAAVYNKAQKLTERAAALDAWANMVTGENNNVIQLKEA